MYFVDIFSMNGNAITIQKNTITKTFRIHCNFALYNRRYDSLDKFKDIVMQNLLYSIVILLLIFWALGFFVYNTGPIIHVLLIAAVIAILLKIVKGEKV